MKLWVIIELVISTLCLIVSSQEIDLYGWSQLIDENLIDDFYHYINKFRLDMSPTCAFKMLQKQEYADCYYSALDRWRSKPDQEKLACCFILDYEYCMLNLIQSECGQFEEIKYRSSDGYVAAKRHIMTIFNCLHRFDDIDDCRLPKWAIILISVVSSLLFICILVILCHYNRKHRKLSKQLTKKLTKRHASLFDRQATPMKPFKYGQIPPYRLKGRAKDRCR